MIQRMKSNDDGGLENDRLSALPESLLCHILSFLPTRTSVATMSLVSRRWRHLWKHLQVFHFDDSDDPNFCDKKFVLFVNSVLALRKSRDIRKFHLTLDSKFEDYNDYVNMWLHAAVGPHLEEFYLLSEHITISILPSFFMDCTNLVSLSLLGEIPISMYDKDSSAYFPSLNMLHLDSYVDSNIVPYLSGCPRLETLDTYFDDENPMAKVFAQLSSSSKSSKSTNDKFTFTYLQSQINYDPYMTMGIVSNFQSMAEAFVHVFPPSESEFVDPILKELRDGLKDVDLLSRHLSSKWPLHTSVLIYPEFRKLHHLKFILPCFNSNLLIDVLEKCRKLRVLIIQSNKEERSPLRTWEPHSTTISKCLKSHLTYIHIEGYQGFEDELTFAEYILRNGLVLKTMLIFTDISMDIKSKDHSIKRFTNISKGSATCQLKFDPDKSP